MSRCVVAVVLAVGLAGCGDGPESSASTGAAEAARQFYEALIQQDWAAAYECLDGAGQARLDRKRFEQLARGHRRALGFNPQEVRVRSCEEHGDEAVIQVVLTGQPVQGARSAKDGVLLRRSTAGWGVVLPARFGQASGRSAR
jgi:hypothetical protein